MGLRLLRRELMLPVSWVSAAFFLLVDSGILGWAFEGPFWLLLEFSWLFAVVMLASIAAVRHGEALAEALGEPYGTLILTAAVTSIELALIASVMLSGSSGPTFARDTMYAEIMIVLNLLVGLGLILGGWKFKEQQYNLQGANAYLVVIIPLTMLGLVLPDFTTSTADPTLNTFQSAFLIIVSLSLYGIFLLIQMSRHRAYFVSPDTTALQADANHIPAKYSSTTYHAILICAYLVAVIFLADQLSRPINHGIEVLGAPAALGGLLVAMLVLTPEGLSGLRSAVRNNLQRAVNVFLGSILATISLTIPAIVTIGIMTDQVVVLGLAKTEALLLGITLLVSMTTFSSVRTNILQGAVHLLLFLIFVVLIFEP